MNDVLEGAVCGVDGCSTQDIPSSAGAERTARQTLSLEVISDAICPWCWVAKHRLDRAIAALGPGNSCPLAGAMLSTCQRRLVLHQNDLALADHPNPVGHLFGLLNIVGGQYDGHA